MFDHTTALVVGAGPAGLLLASELLRRNVACRVIDAHQAPLHWDRATVVHPRSLELFACCMSWPIALGTQRC